MTRYTKVGLLTGVEFVYLFLLWFCFVGKFDKQEMAAGLMAAAIGTIADAVVKARGLAKFEPEPSWLALIFLEPGYVLEGTWIALKVIATKLASKKSQSTFKLLPYVGVGKDARSAAKRTLVITYITLTPNSIVVGIDRDEKQVLIHELEPTPTSLIAKKLGVKG